ncbi:hydrogenase expression/formation protein [Roseospira visakhapatnamensis]|uniref:Hydrogenase-1 operon protein HyaF n=1 Tax=Roseospira visakhapatnamensis TaxID=390880 RepID=A0A7W6REU6_9PROT|nr:hydrogenase expression/formation protein [Roseospira visakhapatnamensis]MBB4267112.1 hydrogenase-1 operon protein HyaF [Roseospira visakhapatnamensis]
MTGAMPWNNHPTGTSAGRPASPSDGAPPAPTLAPAARRARALAEAEALAAAAPEALALVDAMIAHLRRRDGTTPPWVHDMAALSPRGARLLGQILGEGEVSGHVLDAGGGRVVVQESVLTGVWCLLRLDGAGRPRRRWIEIAAVPGVVAAARPGRPAATLTPRPPPAGAITVMPLLAEIADHAARHTPGRPNHVISVSLLPVTRADLAHLGTTLGRGPVMLRVGGHGACVIQAAGVDRVWSVRFLNASDTVILDTLEVGDVPTAACAAPEDFADSAVRLTEIRDAYL